MDLCDEDEEVSSSADCVHAVDRGGLVHASENTYMLFETMDQEKAHSMTDGRIALNNSVR